MDPLMKEVPFNEGGIYSKEKGIFILFEGKKVVIPWNLVSASFCFLYGLMFPVTRPSISMSFSMLIYYNECIMSCQSISGSFGTQSNWESNSHPVDLEIIVTIIFRWFNCFLCLLISVWSQKCIVVPSNIITASNVAI